MLLGSVALVAAFVSPLGLLWAIVGTALVASGLVFARRAARLAMVTPSLVSEGRPSWDGARRSLFSLRADDLDAVAVALADSLDAACGPPLTAVDDATVDGIVDGGDRSMLFGGSDQRVTMAWGVGRPPALRARGATAGIWMRRAPATTGEGARVDVLADLGEAEDLLRRAAEGI